MGNPTGNQTRDLYIQGRWFPPEAIEEALDIAEHALLRRANVLEPNDPEAALLLRTLVARLGPEMLYENIRRGKK